MGKLVNLKLEELIVYADFSMHIALPYKKDARRVDYIGLEGEGPRCLFTSIHNFERQFSRVQDTDILHFVPTLVKIAKRSYLPSENVGLILLEVLKMASLNGKELKDCSIKELVIHCNALRVSLSLEPTTTEKTYKSKAKLIEAIEQLEATIPPFTPDQQANKQTNAAAAEKRLAGLASLKEQKAEEAELKRSKKADKVKSTTPKEADMATKDTSKTKKSLTKETKNTKTAAKAATAKKADKGESKPRRMGIGAYCIELLLKGKSNEETATAAREKFGSTTSASSVAWYRNKLKNEGKLSK
jgi:hypothetical protein